MLVPNIKNMYDRKKQDRKMENIIDYEIKKYTRREGRHYRK
mgnify:FL=1